MRINGDLWRDMILSAANNIENNKKAVNDLNVFPVPDGDTGINMSLTLGAIKKELSEGAGLEIGWVAECAANAMIRSARGNSGVILSLLFRGMAKALKGCADAGPAELSAAFHSGVEAAYKAVMKPTEGTILTVARVSAESAAKVAETSDDPAEFFEELLLQARLTLQQTPELLPVLKQAKVVDAGGFGYVLVLEGMLSALRGAAVAAAEPDADGESRESAQFSDFVTEDILYTYCTEFIVNKDPQTQDASAFTSYLQTIGDSVVAVDDGSFIKVHVHTNHPGQVLEEALSIGALSSIKIENMKEQHTSMSEGQRKEPEKGGGARAKPEKEYGFVAVAAGSGFEMVFQDLGVDHVVMGGQTMNPSTEDILEAVRKTPAHTVFVLPNNKNIIMAAEQVCELTDIKVIVLPTKSVPQGISALLAFQPDADAEQNREQMTEAFTRVRTGLVTYAARNSEFDGKSIKEGQTLGLLEGKLACVCDSGDKCLKKLFKLLVEDMSSPYITLFYGEDVTEDEAERVRDMLSATGQYEINVVRGGQPVYSYILSAE